MGVKPASPASDAPTYNQYGLPTHPQYQAPNFTPGPAPVAFVNGLPVYNMQQPTQAQVQSTLKPQAARVYTDPKLGSVGIVGTTIFPVGRGKGAPFKQEL